jgi:mono/diheme cytochrome c family protein/predicted  nucleic acid-binding Zn-ribbon protein
MSKRPKRDPEQASRSVLFLFSSALLLATGVWAVWNDNISRRPWKWFQHEYREMEYERATSAVDAERKRLEADAEYQKAVADLEAAKKSLEEGDLARDLEARNAELADVDARIKVVDLDVRFVKSELEEAWYEYEHAKEIGGATEAKRERVDSLEKHRVESQAKLDGLNAKRLEVENAIADLRANVTTLEARIEEMATERTKLEQTAEGLLVHVAGPIRTLKVPRIEQTILEEFDRNAYNQPVARVDRCVSCHIGIDRKGFENDPQPYTTHPDRELLLGKHPPDKFGCTACHDGQGAAVNSVAQAHGNVIFWEHPLLHGDEIQARCDGCHASVEGVKHADRLADGRLLFEQLGCHGCHLVTNYGELPKVGPYLRRIGAKVDRSWLTRWVTNPHEFRPRTRMPNFMFSPEEGNAVSAYLLKASAKESEEWLAAHPEPEGIDPANAELVARGQELTQSIGCRGCHGFTAEELGPSLGENKDVAPNLSNVAEKVGGRWIYHWLKDPRHYSPVSKMPSLRLTDEEARALTSYLLTLGEMKPEPAERLATLDAEESVASGEKLVRKYGCAGCHDIPGMEEESRIGVELSTFETKSLEELFFGERQDIPHTWYDWTFHKIKTPRTYATERIEQVMPQFDLADEDIEALIIFLSGRNDHVVPARYRYKPTDPGQQARVDGQRLIAQYNCRGCHEIEADGGFIKAYYEETPSFAPPVLNGEGAKVQPDWLFSFLKQPTPIRPWLSLRMPTFNFSDEEASTLVRYFAATSDLKKPFVHVDAAEIPREHVDAAKMLVSKDYFDCFSCHVQGDSKPEGPPEGWAPDFTKAKTRLNPDWIVQWLHDPQKVQPGTKMPSFYPGGPEDVLEGSDERQIEALRDFLMVIGTPAENAGTQMVQQDGGAES